MHTHSWIRCALMSTNDNTACATQVTKESVIFPRSEDRPHGVLPWHRRADSSLWSLYLQPLTPPVTEADFLARTLLFSASPLCFSKWKVWVDNPLLGLRCPHSLHSAAFQRYVVRNQGYCHDHLNLVSGHDLPPQNEGSYWQDFSWCCLMRTGELTWRPRLHSASGCARSVLSECWAGQLMV